MVAPARKQTDEGRPIHRVGVQGEQPCGGPVFPRCSATMARCTRSAGFSVLGMRVSISFTAAGFVALKARTRFTHSPPRLARVISRIGTRTSPKAARASAAWSFSVSVPDGRQTPLLLQDGPEQRYRLTLEGSQVANRILHRVGWNPQKLPDQGVRALDLHLPPERPAAQAGDQHEHHHSRSPEAVVFRGRT